MVALSEEMSCKELIELVTDYLEGTLLARDRSRFEAHLSECDGCKNYLEQMRLMIKLIGRLPEDILDPKAEKALLQAFQSWNASY